jgi:hypothetical protein
MDPQNLTPEQVQSLFDTIRTLQAEVADLRASRTLTPSSSQGNAIPIATAKSEKLPDPPMFGGNRKELRPFVTKLRLKLQENADRYPTEWNKVNYAMSRLEGDAASTVDPFYRNGSLNTFGALIALLEQTYDDASREYTAMAKLETLRQRNHEFTSFFSEFLGLVGELDWNESAKVAALRRAISDEIRAQLVTQKMPKTLSEFATLCQQIDENLRYNQSARSRRTASRTIPTTTPSNPAAKTPNLSHDAMDVDTTRTRSYAPAGSDERKNRTARGECFGCGQKGHLHKDCPTNPFRKLRSMAPTNSSGNRPDAQNKKAYAASVISTATPQRQPRIRAPSPYESENDSS